MADIDKEIERLLNAYESAVLAKDLNAFMRLYDPGVRVFDTWGVWSYEGATAWERAVDAWFGSLGSEHVRVGFDSVQTLADRDFAVVSGIVSYSGISAGGEPLRRMQNRISWGLRRSGHVLRIVHEHISAPIGFEDLKAILLRDSPA